MEKSDDRNLGVIVSTVLLSVFVAAMAVSRRCLLFGGFGLRARSA